MAGWREGAFSEGMWKSKPPAAAGPRLESPPPASNPRPVGPERAAAAAPPIALLGVAFDNVTFAQALERIEAMVASGQPHYVVTANVDFLVQARQDPELQRIFIDADLVLCDGTPLVWVSRLLRNPLPERVAGSDLVPQIIDRASRKGYRLFFLGGTPEANALAAANVRARFPNVIIAGHYSPPFRPLPEMDHDEIAQRIRAVRPHLLFVSFGCPKAEKWIATHYRSLGVPVTLGVGATIDFLAGRRKRAPIWMQRAGAEWVFRMCQEPRRLFRRYAGDLWHFSRSMAAQWWRTREFLRRARPEPHPSEVVSAPGWQHILLPAHLDAETVRQWQRASIGERAEDRHCLLDLADVRFIDSTGLGLLLRLRREAQATGRCLVLLAPSRAVQRELRWTRLQDFFTTAADPMEARLRIEALARRTPSVPTSGIPQPWEASA